MNKRLLLILKPSNYKNHPEYKKYIQESKTTFAIQSQKTRNIRRLQKYHKQSHSKLITQLYGLDGTLKKQWNYWPTWNKINKLVDTMPIRKQEINYSLYSDDHPNTTTKGIGFKNKEVAQSSIAILSKLPTKKQTQIGNVMIQRAKYHPHKTKDMEQAIKIYQSFLQTLS